MEWREGECSLRSWRDYCAWGTFLAADLPFEASERLKSLLDLLPIFTRLRRQKTTALAANIYINRQLRKLRRVWVSVPFFAPIPFLSSLHESPLYEFGTPCMVIILEYEQSGSFFLIVRRVKRARQANEHEHKWRRETGEHVSRLFPSVFRARAFPSLNPKEKRDYSQFIIIRNQGNFWVWNPKSWALESLI